jgi:hypothetical protein
LGFTTHQFNDDFLWNNRDQTSTNFGGFPKPTESQISGVDKSKIIDYWWKGSSPSMNCLASVQDYLNNGFTKLTNWNTDSLFFGGLDLKNARTAKKIYEEWHPGVFATNYEGSKFESQIFTEDQNGNYPNWIHGADMSCWWSKAPWVWSTIERPLMSFAQKTWGGSNVLINWNEFKSLCDFLTKNNY